MGAGQAGRSQWVWTGCHSTTWAPGTEPAEEGAGIGMELSTCAPPAAHRDPAQGPGGQAQDSSGEDQGRRVQASGALGAGFPTPALPSSSQRYADNSPNRIPEPLTDVESTTKEPERPVTSSSVHQRTVHQLIKDPATPPPTPTQPDL